LFDFLRYVLFDGVIDSTEAISSKGSSSQSSSSGLTLHVSQIHLNYSRVEEHLRVTQDEMAEKRS
jgi:hypothetical protein